MKNKKIRPFDSKHPTDHPDALFVGWKIRISPTQEIRVTRFVLNDKEYIGIRFWRNYSSEGFFFPTQQGIYLEARMAESALLPALVDAIKGLPSNVTELKLTDQPEA